MNSMTTYEIHSTIEMLRSAHNDGALLEQLEAPLRSMVSEIVSRVEKQPLSVYICASDRNAEMRNLFAYVLAMWVQKRVPTTFLVDCDFLATGLSGVVPHRDALGYLDLLLYGTSLNVIAQEANAGVPVIGAGSFPVTKKRPFAMDAFDNTRRYLANHSKCTIYSGPVHDDDDLIHPIIEHVDLVLLVNVGDRFREGILDALESSVISAKSPDAWSVRVNTRPPAKPVVAPSVEKPPAVPEDGGTETLVAEVEGLVEKGTPGGAPAAAEKVADTSPGPTVDGAAGKAAVDRATEAPPPGGRDAEGVHPTEDITGPTLDRKMRSSRWLRIVTPIVGIFLIAFVVWWLYLTKSVRERDQEMAGTTGESAVPEQTTQPADSTAAPATGEQAADEVAVDAKTPQPDVSEDAGQTTSTTAAPERDAATQYANGVPLAERLDDYANKYLVHVSSFRRLDRAREEALYLMGWDYPVFLYRIDLGGKGIWYRVYVGPADTREEARAFKIKLDENPRIQSTRIARVPG